MPPASSDASVLIIGGSGFIGRHTVTEFVDHGYRVTSLARGELPDALTQHEAVNHVRGDRTERDTLTSARESTDPDIVIDLAAYHPEDVDTATEVFAGIDAYVFVSSAAAYDPERFRVPLREGDPLREFHPEHEGDTSRASYGPRKAECDRVCFTAADDGVNAIVVRPSCVYGPYDHTQRHDYWFHRVNTYDRILVPGDGDSTFHRVFVEDVATALRLVAEQGDPGEAYNAAERQTPWLDLTIRLAAVILGTDIELVHANARELAQVDLVPRDFPLYFPLPGVVASAKLASLGWESTPLEDALARTIDEHLESDRTGTDPDTRDFGIDRAVEETLIEDLTQ